jgi:hypothetical protein
MKIERQLFPKVKIVYAYWVHLFLKINNCEYKNRAMLINVRAERNYMNELFIYFNFEI